MNRIVPLLVLVVSLLSNVAAQNNQADRRFELFAGFSDIFTDHGSSGTPLDRFSGLRGVGISGTGYITPRFGITGDFSAHLRSHTENVSGGSVRLRTTSYNYLVGPHFRFSNSTRMTPFVHALIGLSNNRFKATGQGSAASSAPLIYESISDTTMALGGGLDIKVAKRISIRAFQIDYMPVFVGERPNIPGFDGRRFDNVRFSTGIVFRP
jgi:opacity protein-like surface antigen